ncbi:aminodeoxychorismate synthase component I [Paraglaciecola sp. 2405UD69-4]|uniref:aminodeoxychorismate synthase component I n=1 Tax=Paraglaciecola sp. 2405UD69-4 TaxID=3391836 RepID=UPI0039C946F2
MMLNNPLVTIVPITLQAKTCITQIFQHYSHKSWAMLLDSSSSEHENGQYDIMVANPLATITTKGNYSEVTHYNNSKECSNDNPLALLQKLSNQYLSEVELASSVDLPFIIGALGYFGYDLGRRFETLPNKNADEYHTPDMAIGIYSWSIIKDNLSDCFYLCYLDDYPHPSQSEIESLASSNYESQKFTLKSKWQANMSKAAYKQKIAAIKSYLKAGDCYQTNLAQRFTASYEGDEWHAYLNLRRENKAPFSAFIRLSHSSILSISPERFLLVKNKNVETKPIKGTRPRQLEAIADKAQIQSLLSSSKDKAENLMIVDLLRNDLSKHCEAGTVAVPELFKIETFTSVHHLVSKVTAKLKSDKTAIDLLQGAFPGGSITGAPKIRAMEIIEELEPNNRNIYCGSIGYLGIKGDMDTSICIRSLLCEQATIENKIHCWAGGGIVVDSLADDEYQESLDKVSKILPILDADLPKKHPKNI